MTTFPSPLPHLHAGDVVLRPWSGDDAAALFELWRGADIPSEAGVVGFTDRTEASQRIEIWTRLVEAGENLRYAITDARTGALLGAVALTSVRWDDSTAEASYWLGGGDARGRGAATLALDALTRFCFDELGLARVELLIEPSNEPSHAVALRAGFVREGVLRSCVELDGVRVDMVMWSRLPTDPVPELSAAARAEATA